MTIIGTRGATGKKTVNASTHFGNLFEVADDSTTVDDEPELQRLNMEREYSTGTKDDVIYFTGYEVEKTPAEGEHTLFVTGCQPLEDVLAKAKEHSVEHIYLGANHSFVPKESWDDLVRGLLK